MYSTPVKVPPVFHLIPRSTTTPAKKELKEIAGMIT
jgi:hypothetical protein